MTTSQLERVGSIKLVGLVLEFAEKRPKLKINSLVNLAKARFVLIFLAIIIAVFQPM